MVLDCDVAFPSRAGCSPHRDHASVPWDALFLSPSITFVLGITTTLRRSSIARALVPTIFCLPSSLDIFLSFSDVSQLSVMGWLYHFPPNEHCPVSYCCCCSVAKLCLTICDPMDCSPPSSSVHGVFQARILEWVATSSSRGSSQTRDWTRISCTGRWILYHWATREAQLVTIPESSEPDETGSRNDSHQKHSAGKWLLSDGTH